MNVLVYYSKPDISSKTDKKNDCTIRLTHLLQSKNNSIRNRKNKNHYLEKNLVISQNLIKLDKVISSDRVYSIHAILWHKKSLCLELVFVFSLNSTIKSLLYPIVVLQKNKKGERRC